MDMQLRFPRAKIQRLSDQYIDGMRVRDRRLTRETTVNVFPSYERRGYLTKDEFLKVCEWKSPRNPSRCESNDDSTIKEISSLARTTTSDQERIEIWTQLAGIRWPTASVFLHFAFPNRYPILDFRALWSLGVDEPKKAVARCKYPFWSDYARFCRKLARRCGVSMRVLDQALWKFSELNQSRCMA